MGTEQITILGTVFLTVFIAEMGDKTQLLMIAMAKKYRIREILLGVGLAILVLNLLAVAVGSLLGGLLPTMLINFVAGIAFFWFAVSALLSDNEEETIRERGKYGSVFAVFGIFFLGELGDKTQLAALTLAADRSSDGFSFLTMLMVFAGSSLALMAADMIGLGVGCLLGKNIPNHIFSWISYVLFGGFGVLKLLGGFEELFGAEHLNLENALVLQIVATSICAILFVGISICLKLRANSKAVLQNGKGT